MKTHQAMSQCPQLHPGVPLAFCQLSNHPPPTLQTHPYIKLHQHVATDNVTIGVIDVASAIAGTVANAIAIDVASTVANTVSTDVSTAIDMTLLLLLLKLPWPLSLILSLL